MKLTQDDAIDLLIQREQKQRFKGVTEAVSLMGMVSSQKGVKKTSQLNEDRLEGA